MEVRCDADHDHAGVRGGRRAARAARYPAELCDAVCEGLVEHLMRRKAQELEEQTPSKDQGARDVTVPAAIANALEILNVEEREEAGRSTMASVTHAEYGIKGMTMNEFVDEMTEAFVGGTEAREDGVQIREYSAEDMDDSIWQATDDVHDDKPLSLRGVREARSEEMGFVKSIGV